MRVSGKVLLVTGAGSGIGRELVMCLLSKGATVAGVDLNAATLEETAGLASRSTGNFKGFVCNIAELSAVETLRETVLADLGSIDAVINNAGVIQPFTRLKDLDYSAIQRVMNVNFFGTLFVTKAFLPHLLTRPQAHIVNLSSMGGFVPVPGQIIYCAAKAAVKLMSEGLASELEGTNVRVTVVCPGAVATNIRTNSGLATPGSFTNSTAARMLSAEQAAGIIVRGIERDARQVFVGKDATLMDKMYRLSPAFAARAIAAKMKALLPA